jgi:hypothetical protein
MTGNFDLSGVTIVSSFRFSAHAARNLNWAQTFARPISSHPLRPALAPFNIQHSTFNIQHFDSPGTAA